MLCNPILANPKGLPRSIPPPVLPTNIVKQLSQSQSFDDYHEGPTVTSTPCTPLTQQSIFLCLASRLFLQIMATASCLALHRCTTMLTLGPLQSHP